MHNNSNVIYERLQRFTIHAEEAHLMDAITYTTMDACAHDAGNVTSR